jgi:hypothetical protein
MTGQPWRGDTQTSDFAAASAIKANDNPPQARQGYRRWDLAEDHGIVDRVPASWRSKRSLGSIVVVKPLDTTAFRFEKSGTRRPENKTYCLSEGGGT